MAIHRLALLACLALIPMSCSGTGTSGDKTPEDREVEESGDFGRNSVSSGETRYAINCSYWRKGDHMIVCGMSEYPTHPNGPVFLLLLKLGSKGGGFGNSNGVISDAEKTSWYHVFRGTGDLTRTVDYRILHNPLGERFTVDNHEYPLDAGRVILIDLTAEPMQASQVKADLKDLLPKGDSDWRALKDAVQKLHERDDKVRAFWPELR